MLASLRSIVAVWNARSNCVHVAASARKVNSRKASTIYQTERPRRILSGIQPTGDVHLGNYLGVIQNWVELQNSGENVLWSIADMHSITLPHDPKKLSDNILKLTATLIACGIDPKKSILFQQSCIPMHAELCWVLACITTLAKLGHQPQFKEKSETLKEVPLGLYIYPVLQAADILLYRATHVPVGQDQVQHIQLAQSIAATFNRRFGQTFPIPRSLINDNASQRIKSLRDPSKKMSKTNMDPKSRIDLLDEPDIILERVKKALTDFTSEVTYDPQQRPGVSNLISIHSLVTGKTPEQICLEAQGLDTGEYKLVVADSIIQKLCPIRENFSKLIKEPAYLEQSLREGMRKATDIATCCWQDVRTKVGFENDILRASEKHAQNTVLR